MRIHCSNDVTTSTIYAAARHARVDVTITEHGSRSRDHAFDVKLEGESRRRPNGGASGAGSGYAATWDQWGVFLGFIFDVDPDAKCWAYDGRSDFARKTRYRFVKRPATCTCEPFPAYRDQSVTATLVHDDGCESQGAIPYTFKAGGVTYWPTDAHGDHRFEFAGVPRQQSCTKCSAVQTW
jgi:hypothetical protein